MRRILPLFAFALFSASPAFAQQTYCTGTCQTVPSCSQGTTTTISGTVYAPNGKDPLPNVIVYIAGDTVGPLTAGVTCADPKAIPSGAPVAGTLTAADGTFTITHVPVNPAGTKQALVILSGKWRRVIPIDLSAGSCTNTAIDPTQTRFPRNASEGDIPKFAIATGSADPVECVVYKVMNNDATEFTNPSGTGRFNFYLAEGSSATQSGSYIGTPGSTPSASTLMGDPNTLATYDVLMLPCEGTDNTPLRQTGQTTSGELSNLVNFANSGGRVYASHFSYDWLDEAQTFPNVVNWAPQQTAPNDQNATIDTTFADGATLSQWLALPSVGASTTPGQIALQTLRHDLNGVNSPTLSWMALSNGNVMQFTFDTPLAQTTGQCGRILFNEYHVETSITSGSNRQFPALCGTSTTMTPQEKLLEYMLFNLTSNGGNPTLTPETADFGSEPVGFTSGTLPFTWKNTSIFSSAVTLLTTTGDFSIVGGNPCTDVAAGATCTIYVTFTPTAVGARTGTLTVGGGGKTLVAPLTGTGTPPFTATPVALNFGSVDVGASSTLSFQLSNTAPGPVTVPSVIVTGDYTASTTACGASLPANASCSVTVTLRPTATGTRSGSVAFSPALVSSNVTLTGNGIDFSIAVSPTSGTVIAGRGTTTTLSLTPIAGYAAPVSLSCTTSAPGATCTLSKGSLVPAAGATATVTIQTTSQYTVIGYGALGGRGLLVLFAGGSIWFLRRRLRGSRVLLPAALVLLLGAGTLGLTGCGNKAPAQNGTYTGPGSYTFTVTGTDGTITHSATYTLGVTQN